jgi:hypothetical protein
MRETLVKSSASESASSSLFPAAAASFAGAAIADASSSGCVPVSEGNLAWACPFVDLCLEVNKVQLAGPHNAGAISKGQRVSKAE